MLVLVKVPIFQLKSESGQASAAMKRSDVLTAEQRSYCMSRIRGRDTSPETRLRKLLWAFGVRYRIRTRLPGRPDIVITRHRVVVFVDGCFWHKCPVHFVMPRTRSTFWKRKIRKNRSRDRTINEQLTRDHWKVVRIWEHDVEKRLTHACRRVLRAIGSREPRRLRQG
jgi:DNA mismatch endonuclease (patch repair protein)